MQWLLPLADHCSESSGPGGRAISSSWFRKAACAAWRPWLASLLNVRWGLRKSVVAAPCTASMSAFGGLRAWSPFVPRAESGQDSGAMPVIASFEIPHVSLISRKLLSSWATILNSESFLLSWSAIEPVTSAMKLPVGSPPWVAPRCLEFHRLVYAISQENKRTMSPLSANVNFCCLFTRPPGEWRRAGMMIQGFITRRSEFSVAESRFVRCFPRVWLRTKHTNAQARVRACQLWLHFSTAVKRHPRKHHQVLALHRGFCRPTCTKAPSCVRPLRL